MLTSAGLRFVQPPWNEWLMPLQVIIWMMVLIFPVFGAERKRIAFAEDVQIRIRKDGVGYRKPSNLPKGKEEPESFRFKKYNLLLI